MIMTMSMPPGSGATSSLSYGILSGLVYTVCTEASVCNEERGGVVISSLMSIAIPTGLQKMEIYCGTTLASINIPAVQSFDIYGTEGRSSINMIMTTSQFTSVKLSKVNFAGVLALNTGEFEVIDSNINFDNSYLSTNLAIDFNSMQNSVLSNDKQFNKITLLEDTTISGILIAQDNISIKTSKSDLIAFPSSSVILNLNVDSLSFNASSSI